MILQERMRALRKEMDEKQEETAAAIGLTVRQYQRYEAGEQNPNLENFCALAGPLRRVAGLSGGAHGCAADGRRRISRAGTLMVRIPAALFRLVLLNIILSDWIFTIRYLQ